MSRNLNDTDAAIAYLHHCDRVTSPICCRRRGEDHDSLEPARELSIEEQGVKAAALAYLLDLFQSHVTKGEGDGA